MWLHKRNKLIENLRLKIVVTCRILLGLVFSFGAHAQDASKYVGFTNVVPTATIENLRNDKLPQDFELFFVKFKGKALVKVYVGNAPQRLSAGKAGEYRELKFDRLTIGSLWKSGRVAEKEVLVSLNEKEWPMFLQATFVKNLSEAERVEADKLMSSLSFKK